MKKLFTIALLTIIYFQGLSAKEFMMSPPPPGPYAGGTYSVGGVTAYFTTLKEAFDSLNAYGMSGPVILSLQSTYNSSSETFPITPPMVATSVNTITVRPAVAGISITSSAAQTFNIVGSDYFILDGRVNGSGAASLVVANTNTSSPVIQWLDGACNNTIRYCDIRGVSTSSLSGLLHFGTSSGSTGNNNNLVENCNIHDGATTPRILIYSYGTAGKSNTGNLISNNNLYNFYSTSGDMWGILLSAYSADWTISGNSFYQTASRNMGNGAYCQAVATNGTSIGDIDILNNYIGGQAPLCQGSAMTFSSNGVPKFIRINSATTSTTEIQGNIISNVNISSSGTWVSGVIHIFSGSVNCGNTNPNLIGSMTDAGSISVSTTNPSTSWSAIYTENNATVPAINISDNQIGGMTLGGSGSGNGVLRGIWIQGTGFTGILIDGNTLGSATAGISSSLPSNVYGIQSTASLAGQIISNNIVRNLSTTNTGTLNQLTGISMNVTMEGSFQASGNQVFNMTSASAKTSAGGISDCVVGILLNATISSPQIIENNQIYNLECLNTSVQVNVSGIVYNGPASGNNRISGNLVHSFRMFTDNEYASMNGIIITAGNSTLSTRIFNNMVRLGIDGSGNSVTAPLNINGILKRGNSANCAVLSNSVYIGGTGVGSSIGTPRTCAFNRSASGQDTLLNNILVNARTNLVSPSTSKHYASYWNSTSLLHSNYNLYYAPGPDGIVISPNNGLNNYNVLKPLWEMAEMPDLNSGIGDPIFVNPAGTAATVNLHIQGITPAEGSGVAITGVASDIDGDDRLSNTPQDIGADATNATNIDIFTPVISYEDLSDHIVATTRPVTDIIITDQGTGVNNTAGLRPRLYYQKFGDANVIDYTNTPGADGWKWVEANNSSSPYSFTINYALLKDQQVVIGNVIKYFFVAQDMASPVHVGFNALFGGDGSSVSAIDTIPLYPNYYSIVPDISDTVYVGGTYPNYPNLTGPAGLFNTINGRVVSDDVVAVITTDLLEPGTIRLNKWSEVGAGNFKLTIIPGPGGVKKISNDGNITTAMIRLNGADHVILDGGANKELLFRNVHSSPGSAMPVVELNKGTTDCLFYRCVFEGNSSARPVIFLADTGSNYLTIRKCDVRNPSSGSYTTNPKYGIYSNSVANNLVARSNNIFNWIYSGVAMLNCSYTCQIDSNSFYQTGTVSTSNAQVAIEIDNGANHSISCNYIGGTSSRCGGGAWANNSTGNFTGILLNTGVTNLANQITKNVIRNINLSSASSGSFTGINIQNGLVTINGDTVGHPSTSSSIRASGSNPITGILIASNLAHTIDNVLIANITAHNSGTSSITGINLSTGKIRKSKIFSLGNSNAAAAFTAYAIYHNGQASTSSEFTNNMIALNGGSATNPVLYGFYGTGTANTTQVKFYYNSVRIYGPATTNSSTYGMLRAADMPYDMRDNLLINERTAGGSGKHYAIALPNTTPANIISDYNDLYSVSGFVGRWGGSDKTSLAQWSASMTGLDVNSLSVKPNFTSSVDLHLLPANNCFLDGKGTPITGYPTDIDNNARNATPDLGCDEFTPVLPASPVSGGDKTVCFGSTVPALTATGTGILKWFNNPALTTVLYRGNSYNTGQTAVGSYTYYVTDSVGGCESHPTMITLTITPQPVGGAVTPNRTICSGSNSGLLTLAGHTGSVARWEYSTGTFTTWTAITNTNTTYTSGALSVTTKFRAVIHSGTCPEVFSSAATITVTAGPTIVFNTIPNQCINNTTQLLTASPTGGTFTGEGVTGNNFDASAAGVGTWTITYTYDNGVCVGIATKTVTVYDLPNVTFSNALPDQCIGTASYTLTGGLPTGGTYSGPGVTANIFYPPSAGIGTHTLTYAYTSNGCTNFANNYIQVVNGPVPYTVTGGGSYCTGASGLTVTLNGSQPSVNYQLLKNGSPFGSPVTGTGASLQWTNLLAGQYLVSGTLTTGGCTTLMNGNAFITESALPTLFNLVGSGTYCHGAGKTIYLSGSQTTVSYQLKKNGVNEDLPRVGTGDTIQWPDKTSGSYTVTATVISSGCMSNMNGTATLTEDPALSSSISPNPAWLVVGNTIQLNASYSGGTGVYISHQWTGTGAGYLNYTNITNPIFNGTTIGEFPITYTVKDNHNCTSVSTALVHVTSVLTPPTMANQMRCGAGTMTMLAVIGPDANTVEFSMNGNTVLYTDYTAPYELVTGVIPVGSTVTFYARAKNTNSGQISSWVTATATSYTGSLGGTLSGTGNFCIGHATPLYTLSGQIGEIIRWQKRLNEGNWSNINNTGTTYQETPTQAGTWEYRVEIQIPNCLSDYSSVASCIIYPLSVGGNLVGGNSHICLGGSTGTMTLSGSIGTVVSWRKRLNGLAWQNIVYTGSSYSETPTSTGVWEYQAELKSGSCSSTYSSSFSVQVDPVTVGGIVTGGTAICPGTSTPMLVLSGQNGTVVRWQKNLNGGSWVDIAHTLTSYSEVPSSSGTWQYRVVVQNGICSQEYSGAATVTVYTASIGGQVNGGSTICLGSSTGNLVLSGYNNNILRWQKRYNNGSWINIGNTSTIFSEVPISVGTWDYRAVIGISSCVEAYSTFTTVSVLAAAGGGNVTGGTTICSGQTSGVLTLTGYTGTILRWQSSVSPFTVWTDIAHTSPTYVSGPLTQTTQFRAVVQSGYCPEVISGYTTVTISPPPVVTFSGILTSQCVTSTSYVLTGGSPFGGSYSGTGVTANLFNASVAGVGTHVITYTYINGYGCQASATNTITVYALPTVSFSNTIPGQCLNSTPFTLTGGTPSGGSYSGPGVIGNVFSPAVAGPGAHTITYTYTSAQGCSNSATNSITVSNLPVAYLLTGSGGFCQAGGLVVNLSGSQLGVSYQLKKDGVNYGSTIAGTGNALTWTGLNTGVYTAYGTNTISNCQSNMNGTVTLTQNPLPADFQLTGSGHYCYGGAGKNIVLTGSETGVSYQLKRNGLNQGLPLAGTGSSLTWTNNLEGNYTVTATIVLTGCSTIMTGIVVITEDAAITPAITPDPAYVVIGNNLTLNGNPSGGSGTFLTHVWSGPGATYLNSTSVVNPVFNSPVYGNFDLTYSVIDNHGCTGSDNITIHATSQIAEPNMPNQYRCGTGTINMIATVGSGGDQVQFSLDGSVVVFTDNTAPYEYVTPVIPAGGSLVIYARSRSSATGVTSNWISASAIAYGSSIGGSLSGGGTICQGSSTPVLSLTGQIGDVVQWWRRYNSGSWVVINHTGTTYSEVISTAGTYDYRVEVLISGCTPAYSSTTTVTVNPSSGGGTLGGGNGTICLGTSTGSIVLSGYTGSVQSWRKRWNNSIWQQIGFTGTIYAENPSQAGTWEYQAEVKSGTCPSAYSTIISIQVDNQTVAGSVTGGGSICPGSYTPILTASGYTGNILKWQKRLNSGTWADISNTLPTYSEVLTTQGTWYYRIQVQQGVCPAEYSSTASVVVVAQSVGGVVTGGSTICEGASTATLSLIGQVGDVSKWQKRFNGGTWTDIANTLTTYSEVPSAVGNWDYRAVVTLSFCTESYATPATVVVVTQTLGGAVTSDHNVCNGQPSQVLSLANHYGSVVKWQKSVAPFNTWLDIINTSTTYTSGPLTQTTRFRAVVRNGNCDEVPSSYATVTVLSPPTVAFNGILAPQCITSTSYTLTGGSPSGGSYSGDGVTGTNFNAVVAGLGVHSITYTYTDTYGCMNTASNSITVEDLPAVTFTGNLPAQCVGAPLLTLSGGSPSGGSYTGPGVSNNQFNATSAGVGAHLLTYIYTNATGCSGNDTNTITVNPLPLVYAVSGNGSYCPGSAGLTVSLSGSQLNINYQLYKNGTSFGSSVPGTGTSLSWPNLTEGTYTVQATNSLTGCASPMAGNAVIVQNSLPLIYTLGGSGSYCYGSFGMTITLSGSETGVSYQLFKNGTVQGAPLTGTGSAVNWTEQTAGSYTVAATVITTGCSRPMSGTVVITEELAINVSILPSPAYVIVGNTLVLQGFAFGGTGSFNTYSWSGAGASYLSNTLSPLTVFNATNEGDFPLIYTVTDTHGCTEETDITVHVTQAVMEPQVFDTLRCGSGTMMVRAIPGSGGSEVQFSVNGLDIAYTDNIPPYEFTTPPVIAGNSMTIFARTRNDVSGFFSAWETATASAYEASIGGNLDGTGVICQGSNTPLMVLTEYVGTINKWQKRVDGGIWTDISNTEYQLTDIPGSAGTWDYRVEVEIEGCDPAYSTLATFVVNPTTVGGYLTTPSLNVCLGQPTQTITLNGQTGEVLYWQKRQVPGEWQVIFQTGTTLVDVPATLGSWQYQVMVKSGVCQAQLSPALTLFVVEPSVGGNVSGGTAICEGSSTPVLTLANYSGFVTNWQKRVNNGSWTNIVNTAVTYSEIPSQAGTWEYRAAVTNNNCDPAYSTSTTVLVVPTTVGGQLSGGGVLCLGASTGYMVLSGYVGTIQKWQKKFENGNWVDISYIFPYYSTVPNQPGTWYYRVQVNNGTCGTSYSNIVQYQVSANTVAGSVSGGSLICQGSNTGTLVLSGHTGSVVKWQKRHNGGNWTDILYTQTTYAEVVNSTGTWDYRAAVRNGNCSVEYATPTTVTVANFSVGGYVTNGSTICLGSSTDTLQLLNYSGDIVRWQKRLNGGSWTDIANTMPVYQETPDIPGTWDYRAVVQNTGCLEAYATAVTVVVNPNPVVFNLSGPDYYCYGSAGVTLVLSGSEAGVSYQLKKNGSNLGPIRTGTGDTLQWSNLLNGSYYVRATWAASGCNKDMTGIIVVQSMPNPVQYYISASGYDCDGVGQGVVTLSGSELGLSYQLMQNQGMIGFPITGNGNAITWQNLNAGSYWVEATDPGSGCESVMSGTGVIQTGHFPWQFNVTGGGSICSDGQGVDIGISGSQSGVQYYLIQNGIPLYSTLITGNGQPLTFGTFNIPGIYYVHAQNLTSACALVMDQYATITLLESPVVDAGPDLSCLYGTGVSMGVIIYGGTPPYTFSWSPVSGLSDPYALNPLANPIDTTTYTIQVMDANGCITSDQVTISPFVPEGQSVVQGVITYANTVSTPLHNVQVFLKDTDGNLISQTSTTSDGSYYFPPFPNGIYYLSATLDAPVGGINATDALQALKHFVQMITLQGIYKLAGDVDNSQYINSVDALFIQHFFTGFINSFPAGDWVFEKKLLTFNSDIYFHNLKGLCVGDVNGSYIPPLKQEPLLLSQDYGTMEARTGDLIEIPIVIKSPLPPAGLSIDMTLDPNLLDPLAVVVPEKNNSWVWNITGNRIRITAVAVDGLTSGIDDLRFVLQARVLNKIEGQAWLQSVSGEVADVWGVPMEALILKPAIKSGNSDNPCSLMVYPNPAQDQVTLSFSSGGAARVHVEMLDAASRIVLEKDFSCDHEGTYLQPLDIRTLKPGLYLVKAQFEVNGKLTVIQTKLAVLLD